jgi:hypothetical protein
MPLFTRTRTNPIFYRDRLAALLAGEPDRLERIRTARDSIDLLTWNVFASLDTHRDPAWLAYRLQALGGGDLRAPVRISLFSGARRTPYLQPSPAYVRAIHQRAGVNHEITDSVAVFEQPIEVPVRIETPDVLLLVDTGLDRLRTGSGGRDRLAELADTGLEHARRLSSSLAVGVVANAGSAVLGTRLRKLGEPDAVKALLPWRRSVPAVEFRGMSWTALLRLWQEEHHDLDLDGQPVKDFLAYAEQSAR